MSDVLGRIRDAPPGGFSLAEYQALARELPTQGSGLDPVRLVLLASFTTRMLDAHLRVEAARHGLLLDVHHGAYAQFEQELADGGWERGGTHASVLVLAMRLEDVAPSIRHRFHAKGDAHDRLVDDTLERIERLIAMFRERSGGPVLVANFAPPDPRPLGIFDAGTPGSLTMLVADLNRRLAERLQRSSACFVWDYAGLVSEAGSAGWTDPRLWALGRIPVAPQQQPRLGAHLARALRAVLRPSAKCLAVDLDGVLWGGVLGDDGIEGIALGDDHPGLAHKELQRAILGLRDRGILLAICSKNDEAVAREAIANHPEMVVTLDDFAAMRINWNAKSANLREIAEELSIGIDSIVFFDDNPFERGEVALSLPMVCVPPVPADPVEYVRALADVALFDMPRLTTEDRERAAAYQVARVRQEEARTASSVETFLASLEMQATIGSLGPLTSSRIAQLVAKTNQFNLTTRRQSQAELEAAEASLDHAVRWLRLADRHGDLGLIAVAVVRYEHGDAVIHNLVLSCRAANRGVERALVAHVAAEARERGCRRLVGEYVPSPRNHVVESLYPDLGFEAVPGEDEPKRFVWDLSTASVESAAHIRVHVEAEERLPVARHGR